MKNGSVYQRHLKRCPRDAHGQLLPHRCKGPWAYQFDLERGLDGRRRQETKTGFLTKKDAVTALREAARRAAESDLESHDLTVAEFLDAWLASKRRLRPSTAQAYRSHLDLYLVPHLGRLRLNDLRARHLDQLYLAIANGTRGRPLTATTLRRIHATLRSALTTAVRRRLLQDNPANHVELPAIRRRPADVWTPEQLGAFLDAVSSDRLYALWLVVSLTGLRRGEAIGLRWQDVDTRAGLLRIRQQIVEVRGELVVGEPKTRSGVRLVPLDPGTVNALRAHQARQELERARWGEAWHDTGLVFTYEDGRMLRPELATRRFQALSRHAGVPVIRFHGLRHTSASLALAAGVPMRVVSDRLGHSSTAITADLYTHVSPVVAGTAADAIASIVPRRGHAAAVPDASAMQAPAPGALPTEHGSGGETAGEEGWAARGSNPEPAD